MHKYYKTFCTTEITYQAKVFIYLKCSYALSTLM